MLKPTLLILCTALLCSCQTIDSGHRVDTVSFKNTSAKKKVLVRLTVYWADGEGSDRWSKKRNSASGDKLKEGVSVAADPRIFPYGTKVNIEGIGSRMVVDTGTAVKRKTASKKVGSECPVIDLFFQNRQEALNFAQSNPPFVFVEVEI